MQMGNLKHVVLSAVAALMVAVPSQASELRAHVIAECPNKADNRGEQLDGLGLAAILIPELISAGVDLAATALSESAKAKTVSFVADSNTFNLYKLNAKAELSFNKEKVGCLLVYLPAAKDQRGKGASGPVPEWFMKVQGKVAGLTDPPDLYFEAEINTESRFKLNLRPQLLAVSRPLQDGFGRKKARGYVFALSFMDVDSLASYGAATFTFDDIPVGVWSNDGRAGTKQADWPLDAAVTRMPDNAAITEAIAYQKSETAPYRSANALLKQRYNYDKAVLSSSPPDSMFSEGYEKALKKMCEALRAANPPNTKVTDDRCPVGVFVAKRDFAVATDRVALEVGSAWANTFLLKYCSDSKVQEKDGPEVCALPGPKVSEIGYSRVSVSVVETSEASQFVQTLVKTFNSKKEEVKTALNDKYNPVRREDIAETAAGKERDARNAFRIAMLTVQQIEAQLIEAVDKPESTRTTLHIQLAQAKINANKAAASAGSAMPYQDYE